MSTPQSTPQPTPPPSTQQPSIDLGTLQAVADLAVQTLQGTLGILGAPSPTEVAQALYEALEPYTDPEGPALLPGDRFTTLALLEGRVMLVLDHQAWAWQVFAVTSPACRLPGSPASPEPQVDLDADLG